MTKLRYNRFNAKSASLLLANSNIKSDSYLTGHILLTGDVSRFVLTNQ